MTPIDRLFQTVVIWPLVCMANLGGLLVSSIAVWGELCLEEFVTIWID